MGVTSENNGNMTSRCIGNDLYGFLYMSHVMRILFKPYANNKGADQPAHPRSLISAFVVCCLDSIITSRANRFESYLIETHEDRFFNITWLILQMVRGACVTMT